MVRSAKSVVWVLWCVGWAGVWFALGFRTLGVTWTLTVLSLGAACLPVGTVLRALPHSRPRGRTGAPGRDVGGPRGRPRP